MTLIQEATGIMEKMPIRNQQIIVDLLKAMYSGIESTDDSKVKAGFSRTGKAQFNLPADFDAHFDDLNEEIAASFLGDSL